MSNPDLPTTQETKPAAKIRAGEKLTRDIEVAVDQIDEFIDQLGQEIDLLTDEDISDEVVEAASDLVRVAEDAGEDIRRALANLCNSFDDD